MEVSAARKTSKALTRVAKGLLLANEWEDLGTDKIKNFLFVHWHSTCWLNIREATFLLFINGVFHLKFVMSKWCFKAFACANPFIYLWLTWKISSWRKQGVHMILVPAFLACTHAFSHVSVFMICPKFPMLIVVYPREHFCNKSSLPIIINVTEIQNSSKWLQRRPYFSKCEDSCRQYIV